MQTQKLLLSIFTVVCTYTLRVIARVVEAKWFKLHCAQSGSSENEALTMARYIHMKLREWTINKPEFIKRASSLEEAGFSVTMKPAKDYVELIIRKRKT